VRIERVWVDVTVQFGAKWAELFQNLEIHCALNINSRDHIWLLHYLFLPTINQDCAAFVRTWNNHRLQIRDQPNRSPIDMFGFDMLVHGSRGDHLSLEELEMYGVDWEALGEDSIRRSQAENNSQHESFSTWLGREGPPPDLSEVSVDPPPGPLSAELLSGLDAHVGVLYEHADVGSLEQRWVQGLGFVRSVLPLF
jgi:hypothetical protein